MVLTNAQNARHNRIMIRDFRLSQQSKDNKINKPQSFETSKTIRPPTQRQSNNAFCNRNKAFLNPLYFEFSACIYYLGGGGVGVTQTISSTLFLFARNKKNCWKKGEIFNEL
jgi:hypothetical protein